MKNIQINPKLIAVCMFTYYPHWHPGEVKSIADTEKIRGDIALQTIEKSVSNGYHTIVTYSDNDTEFNSALHTIDNVIRLPRTSASATRSAARRQAIQQASEINGVQAIITTEPEKLSFISDSIESVAEPLILNQADVIVPRRNEQLFKQTYPDYMYESEIEGNFFYNEALRAYKLLPSLHNGFDIFFGPKALRNDQKIIDLFLKKYELPHIDYTSFTNLFTSPDDMSNCVCFPVVEALFKRYRVEEIEVPFEYPATQKDNEEKGRKEEFIKKRKAQKLTLISELVHFLATDSARAV